MQGWHVHCCDLKLREGTSYMSLRKECPLGCFVTLCMQGLTCCKPSDAKLYFFHIGMCYESSKNLPKAIAQYKRATELDTNYRCIVVALIGCGISTLSVLSMFHAEMLHGDWRLRYRRVATALL